MSGSSSGDRGAKYAIAEERARVRNPQLCRNNGRTRHDEDTFGYCHVNTCLGVAGSDCLGIHENLHNSIMACGDKSKEEFLGSIVLAGANTMFPGTKKCRHPVGEMHE